MNIKNIHPDNEKLTIGVKNAPTLQPFEKRVPIPNNNPETAAIAAPFGEIANFGANFFANNNAIIAPMKIEIF